MSEDREPVAYRWMWAGTNQWHYSNYNLHPDAETVQRLYLAPTPDKLALAVEALELIRDLGSDGEHSGDRHARCRDFARSALAAIKAAD